MNKYNALFKPDFSTKQVSLLYLRLIDNVINNEEELKLLEDAHRAAYSRALKNAFEEQEKVSANGNAVLCIN